MWAMRAERRIAAAADPDLDPAISDRFEEQNDVDIRGAAS
jgi:hypothetical protein